MMASGKGRSMKEHLVISLLLELDSAMGISCL